MAYTFSGGKRLNKHMRSIRKLPLRNMRDCGEYVFFLNQNGSELNLLVSEGDKIKAGDKLADEENYGFVPLISSVSGTVERIENRINPNGHIEKAVIVKSDGEFRMGEKITAPSGNLTPLEKLWLIREAGIVEGDGFPTHVIIGNKKAMDYLILNGAECSPYTCSDYRRVTENTDEVIDGFMTALDIVNARYGIIVLDTSMKKAKRRIMQLIRYNKKIKIITVKNKFPQNDEKILTETITGRSIPKFRGCADVGVTIIGIESAYNISVALHSGTPVLTKPVTVCGKSVAASANINARIGAPVSALFNECGGITENAPKIIYGNQFYGTAWDRPDIPVTATTACAAAVSSIPNNVSELYLQ